MDFNIISLQVPTKWANHIRFSSHEMASPFPWWQQRNGRNNSGAPGTKWGHCGGEFGHSMSLVLHKKCDKFVCTAHELEQRLGYKNPSPAELKPQFQFSLLLPFLLLRKFHFHRSCFHQFFGVIMASEYIYVVIYPNEKILYTAEGVTFMCDDPLWITIPPQSCLQQLKNMILMNTGLIEKKEISTLIYKMPVTVASSFTYQKMHIKSDQYVSMMFSYHHSIGSIYSMELCVKLQDVGGSSSSLNNVEEMRNSGAGESIPFWRLVGLAVRPLTPSRPLPRM
ncbi:hypothetical protein Ahy_B04g073729 [Arachis hypogaea]|uniref:Uncharacterized protein n=1 Tax=Arachis hypogaea TaxID=3818 RepID=A0A444ZR64_ARAHY|nr:hypothetical protein Ahy_B04g073729 [Arachis hypogaea]